MAPVFNRNIVTRQDIDNLADAARPRTLTASPPARPLDSSDQPVRETEDDYLTKVLKYVPLEIVAFYIFVANVISSNVVKHHDRSVWLGGLLIVTVAGTIPYDRMVLGVVRKLQIAVSTVGIIVYVFSLGGWFATTTWYHAWYASIALAVFGLTVAILRVPALPTDPPVQGSQYTSTT